MLAIEQTPTQEKEISPSMQEVIMQAVKNEFIPNEKPITTDNVLSFVRENFKEDVARKTIHCDLGRLVKKGELSRVTDGVYQVRTEDSFALMIHGDGRNLSMFEKDSVDAVYYDHAWDDGANKDPGARKED